LGCLSLLLISLAIISLAIKLGDTALTIMDFLDKVLQGT
jgi:hypothetical protein